MSMTPFDQAAQSAASWLVNQIVGRCSDHAGIRDLRALADYFSDIERNVITIGNENDIEITCMSNSWFPGADLDDKVGCVLSFNGIYLTLDLFAKIKSDHGVFHRVVTDFQGDVTGHLTDLILFHTVAERVLASADCDFYFELYDITLSDMPF